MRKQFATITKGASSLQPTPLSDQELARLRSEGDPGASDEVLAGWFIIITGFALLAVMLYLIKTHDPPIFVLFAPVLPWLLGAVFLYSGKKRQARVKEDLEAREKYAINGFIASKRENRSKSNNWYYFQITSGPIDCECEVGVTTYTRHDEGDRVTAHIAKHSKVLLGITSNP